ncbi:hypothetical protein S40285_08669 [Stachybotrys chlorohalonatus IBT 40285]|uniref:C2H2-type domain-containing protein n=1 Tax=Stachybotrys chlorohalonatus (strain IBT 40285) TaxID=1283841 RepID=A0A084QZA0_STAC4|nr:hypothetical protein S40285_08669 [Stachybotrys chlorohalonata IBT 40285]
MAVEPCRSREIAQCSNAAGHRSNSPPCQSPHLHIRNGLYDGDLRLSSSGFSSAPSATSSAVSSPQSHHGQMGPLSDWSAYPLDILLTIVGNEYMANYDYSRYQNPIHHYPVSPSAASSSLQPPMLRTSSASPFYSNTGFQNTFNASLCPAPMDSHRRCPSATAFISPTPNRDYHSGNETKEEQCCTYPDCGKTFKDLKAHMLTHQTERPEKCPIQTCEYHVKGFARKYDKNRHTLTHYKGNMVCGFCPGSGSAAEKSFNRADVFKRHLTAVHGIEQTPPNRRKKTSNGLGGDGKKLSGYAPDATGKCSTCSRTFSNAQDFYEHLDDCVLRIVQQEDPAEAINAQRLAEVENDKIVHQTLEKNNLPTTTQTTSFAEDDDDDDMVEEDAEDASRTCSPVTKKKTNPVGGVQKSRGLTHSRGGVHLATKTKSRKHRRVYPTSWGFDKSRMTMKKRVMAVFDGPRRLAKDDMMLCTAHEVRIRLADGKSYITDLDVQTLRRAEAFHNATEDEKGPWISADPNEEQLNEMRQMLATSPASV